MALDQLSFLVHNTIMCHKCLYIYQQSRSNFACGGTVKYGLCVCVSLDAIQFTGGKTNLLTSNAKSINLLKRKSIFFVAVVCCCFFLSVFILRSSSRRTGHFETVSTFKAKKPGKSKWWPGSLEDGKKKDGRLEA